MAARAFPVAVAAAAILAGCGSQTASENRTAPANAAAPATPQAPPPAAPPTAANPASATPGVPEAPAAGNGASAAPPVAAPPSSATGYALVGTEPFWGGSVHGTRVRYMTPENQFGSVVETTRSTAGGSDVYRGRLGGQPFVLTLRRAACSDGMSDRTYAFTATLEVRGERRRGCADPE